MQYKSDRQKKIFSNYLIYICLLIVILFFVFKNSYFNYSKPGLVFYPNRTVYYHTSEYNITVFTNNLGFRDRNVSRKKDVRTRIVVIGDSFTYGWGVNLDDTWPKILERMLASNNVEILNLGFPTGNFYNYLLIARRAIPFLRPDIVILAAEQGGDIAQLSQYENSANKNLNKKFSYIQNKFNIWKKVITSKEIRMLWREAARQSLTKAEQKNIFIEKQIRDLLLAGDLNPALLKDAINDPYAFTHGYSKQDPLSPVLIKKMEKYISEMDKICKYNRVKLIVLSLPMGAYCSEYQHQNLKKQGLFLEDSMLQSHYQDKIVKNVCDKLKLIFYEFTDMFRAQDKITPLFYCYDGHYNVKGQHYLTELIAAQLKILIK